MPNRSSLWGSARRWSLPLALLLIASVGCSQFAGGGSGRGGPGEAAELFEALKAQQAAGNLDAAAATARELIQGHPTFPNIDEATFRAGEIALAQNRFADAAKRFEAVASNYPLSPFHDRSLVMASRSYAGVDMPLEAADALLRLLSSPVEESLRNEARGDLAALIDQRLSAPQLETLVKKFPSSDLSSQAALRVAREQYANGDYDDAYKLLSEYLYRFPEGTDAPDARRLLSAVSQRRQAPLAPVPSTVDPNTVGIVLPLTGPGALYGRYFAQGVDVAVEEHNAASKRRVNLVQADSKGSPVGAVRAVRKLLLEDAAVGVVGSVFTVPTIAASIEANAWGAALLSPVVSSDELIDIGPWVFETKVPSEVEVTAVAEVAVKNLVIGRFAVVAPSSGPRRALGDLFRDEVVRLGAEVVAMQYYETGATDFREQLEAVREAAPEAIFAPGSVEELLLLIPQVKFYDLQTQLLGLSNWSSDKLLRLSGDELEGAIFPVEAYRGKDPTAYARFKEAMTRRGVPEISPISEAGYFGMRLMLQALDAGASSREDVRGFLDGELRQGATGRMAEAKALSFSRVRGGRVVEFDAARP